MAINATHDPDVLDINAIALLPTVGRQGFGLVLLVGPNSSTGNLIQSFSSGAAARTAATAGNITNEQRDYIEAAYNQANKPRAVLVCRRAADVAQVVDFVVVGTADGDYVIELDGVAFEYTAASKTAAQIATELVALIDADALYTASVVTSTTVRVTAATVGGIFDYAVDAPEASSITPTVSTPGVNLTTVLDAAKIERDDWYGVALQSRTDLDNARLAMWALTNKRFGGAQSSAAALKTAGADWSTPFADNPNILIGYRATDSSKAVFLWMTSKLSANLDRQTTSWALCRLVGEVADNLTDTDKSNLAAKNINYYLPLLKQDCWRTGKMRSGMYADERTSIDWILARIKERTGQLMLDLSQINDKVPYDDDGFAQLEAVALGVIQQGERTGHIRRGTGRVRYLRIDELDDTALENREAQFSFGGVFGGAVEATSGIGYFSRNDEFIASLFDDPDAVIAE